MRIDLREHGPPLDVALPAHVAGPLADRGLVDVRPLSGSTWRLTPSDRVGAVRVGAVDVVVEPKIGPESLLFLLGYADNPGFRPDQIDGSERQDLFPIVAESLARQVELAMGGGVLQGYVTVDESAFTVRGRIRAADQMSRRAALPLPVEVSFDDYSPDIAENRILRTAIRRMLSVPRIAADVRRRLGHLDGRLDGVTLLIPGLPRPAWTPTRLNERYHRALRVAEIVLRHMSAVAGPGDIPLAAFVVDMAKVFEDFVTVALQEATAHLPGAMRAQQGSDLSVNGSVRVFPDVMYVVNGVSRAVFDAKYKIVGGSRSAPNADVYQMLAYCAALRLDRGHLIYAKGNGEPATHRIVHIHPTVDIIQHPLDLESGPSNVLGQISRLVADALDQDRLTSAPSTGR